MVEAAGGLVVRKDGRVAVVHRPRYDDWSLPKGKLEKGESFKKAALREVEEECDLRCKLHEELPSDTYKVRRGKKIVRWWRMSVIEDLGSKPTTRSTSCAGSNRPRPPRSSATTTTGC